MRDGFVVVFIIFNFFFFVFRVSPNRLLFSPYDCRLRACKYVICYLLESRSPIALVTAADENAVRTTRDGVDSFLDAPVENPIEISRFRCLARISLRRLRDGRTSSLTVTDFYAQRLAACTRGGSNRRHSVTDETLTHRRQLV